MTGNIYKDDGREDLVVHFSATQTRNCLAPPGDISDCDGVGAVAQTASVDVISGSTARTRGLTAGKAASEM